MEPGSAALEPRAPQRVMITRMVLDNFKSYAGPITIGPFDANMTSVVGPNGSGKSNVIDAMLFVFGFRANKMRQGKLSELIHSSSRHPNLQYTKVSVHFRDVVDLPDGTVQPVEGTELVVAREAKQDNSSTYWVNGKRAGREEVVTLLKRRGIDLDHNRFLILQGEVEQIAMMKPKAPSAHEDGLLEYLEDIIGSNRLKEPIAEAQTQVETLNESRAARLNALKSVEQQMQSLEPRKAEAETYLHTEAQLHEKRSALYQLSATQCQAVVTDSEAKVELLSERLRDEKEKAKANAGELAGLEKAYKKGKKEHETVLAQLDESKKLFQSYERDDLQKREEKAHLKTQIKKAAATADKDSRKLASLRDEIASLGGDVPRLQAEAEAAAATRQAAEAELEKMYDALRGQTEPLRRKIETAQREREPLAQALAGVLSEQQLAESEHQILADKAAKGAAAVESAAASLALHDETVARSRAEFDGHAATSAELQAKLAAR
jgi:structural maintenance of chromosome 4